MWGASGLSSAGNPRSVLEGREEARVNTLEFGDWEMDDAEALNGLVSRPAGKSGAFSVLGGAAWHGTYVQSHLGQAKIGGYIHAGVREGKACGHLRQRWSRHNSAGAAS